MQNLKLYSLSFFCVSLLPVSVFLLSYLSRILRIVGRGRILLVRKGMHEKEWRGLFGMYSKVVSMAVNVWRESFLEL